VDDGTDGPPGTSSTAVLVPQKWEENHKKSNQKNATETTFLRLIFSHFHRSRRLIDIDYFLMLIYDRLAHAHVD